MFEAAYYSRDYCAGIQSISLRRPSAALARDDPLAVDEAHYSAAGVSGDGAAVKLRRASCYFRTPL